MGNQQRTQTVIRFGSFEADLHTQELRRHGTLLRLPSQSFQILQMLLERRGTLVTRDELRAVLWPSDTFVDFDHGLHAAVNRLRQALGDSADRPRWIETLPRRGYRFIAPVERSPDSAEAAVVDHQKRPKPIFQRRWIAIVLLVPMMIGAVAALLLGLNVRGWRDRVFMQAPKSQIQALAVLPLTNLSGDPEQEYFADGMTESLITELGKISGLRVISRQSVMQYEGSKKALQEIAKELRVDGVLEGAVERLGDRVRVTVRLDQVSPEGQLWSKQYNRDIRDLLRLQDEIARAVTDEVQVKLKPQERARLASSLPVDPGAQDDYLRALHFRNKRDLLTAISYFRQATEKDANYGPAYAGMAQAYINLGNSGGYPKETLPLAKAAATRAVEVNPMLGEAHFVLAQTLELYDWNWSEAQRQYKLALELSPNYEPAHVGYGRFLQSILGRNDEAMKQIAYAAELNPRDPEIRLVLGFVTFAARQYDSAIAQFKAINAADPGEGDLGLGWSYRGKKMYPEAIAALERALALSRPPIILASLASVYGLAGRKREAVKLIDELKEGARQHYVPAAHFAEAYIGLGEKDEAMAWMERAYEEHDQGMVDINAYPGLDALRSEPRFQALVRRINFPQ